MNRKNRQAVELKRNKMLSRSRRLEQEEQEAEEEEDQGRQLRNQLAETRRLICEDEVSDQEESADIDVELEDEEVESFRRDSPASRPAEMEEQSSGRQLKFSVYNILNLSTSQPAASSQQQQAAAAASRPIAQVLPVKTVVGR